MGKGPFLILLLILLIAGGSFLFYSRSSLSPYLAPAISDDAGQPVPASPWRMIREAIAGCRVTQVSQAHSLQVSARLKDGTTLRAKEPKIDAIISAAQEAEDLCGPIPMATE